MKNVIFTIFLLVTTLFYGQQQVETYTTPGSGSFVVPANVSEITIETWGAGGRGGNTSKSGGNQVISAGGGGGGAYSRTTLNVTQGQVINYNVGAGSTSTAAGEASQTSTSSGLGTTVLTRALGGNSVGNNSSVGATGGLASGGIGTTRYNGGNGANASGNNAGGGGSSAGTNSAGANATGITGATAPTGGGNGGNGATSASGNGQYNGVAGFTPGAGGGGSAVAGGGNLNGVGGAGANGRVVITYNVVSIPQSDLSISLSANNGTPEINDQVTFTITAENIGNLNDSGVIANVLVPGGFEFVNATATGGVYNPNTGIWNLGNFNSGSSATLTINANAIVAGSSNFVADISGNESDSDTGNNQVSLTLPISCANSLVSETTNYGAIQANWRFDGNTNDSQNSFNAQNGAPTSYSSDFLEGTESASFDGTATIQYSNGSFLNDPTSVISIAGWIRPTNLTGQRIIFDEGGATNGFVVWMNNDILTLSTRNGGAGSQVDLEASASLQLDVWQHIAAVFDNGNLRIYLNGFEDATTAGYTSINNHGDSGGLGGELGGSSSIGGTPLNYIGLLDAFVYSSSTSFTASEILADAEQDCIFTGTCPEPTTKQTPVTNLLATYRERPTQTNLYTIGSDNYSFSLGTDNDLRLDAFTVNDPTQGEFNLAFESLADRIVLRRNDNAGTTGNRHILFFEQLAGGSGTDFSGPYIPRMEEALLCQCINRGSDNVFANAGGTNINNIERIDFIFERGIEVPNNPEEVGFVILERGGNDDFNLAPIESLDAQNNPASYRDVKQYFVADWDSTLYDINTGVLSGFTEAPDNERPRITASVGSQNIGAIFISFDDLGFCPGEIIYGYSLAGADSTTDPVAFVDFNDTTSFPTNTQAGSNASGGLDLLSGGAVSVKSFIHVPGGWFDNDNPSGLNNCDERVVISGGDAQFSQNTTVGEITVNEGRASLNANTLSICKDVDALSNNFEVRGGTMRMIGTTGTQTIKGRGSMIVDRLESNNPDGVDVDVPVRIDGSISVEAGTVNSKGNLTFYCDFSGNNPKTGMVDDLSNGNLIGDVTTQQCFPGRRAFRLITATTTTTGPIREYWQEDASAWNDNPVPGYGTHITGLGVENGTPTNDGLNGFDWQPSGNPSLFVFDNVAGTWSPIDNTDVNTLVAGEPYRIMIRGSRDVNIQFNASPSSNTILRASGPITKGPVTYNDPGFGNELNDVIFIGNPFQAIVDLALTYSKSSNIRPFVQVYDPRLGGIENDGFLGGRGAFTNVNVLENQNSNPDSDANKFLQAYQSVYFLADGSGQPSIVFAEPDKRIQEDQTETFSVAENYSTLRLNLYDLSSFEAGNTSRDALVVKFGDQFQNDWDLQDAPKMENPDENFARIIEGNLSSYESRSLPNVNDILPLYIDKYRMTDYVMTVDATDFNSNLNMYLKDQYTGELHLIEQGFKNEIYFNVNSNINASIAFNRFRLEFGEVETLGVNEASANQFSVFPNPVEDHFQVNMPINSNSSAQVEIYDVLGKRVYSNSFEAVNGKIHVNGFELSQGAYVVKFTTAEGKTYSQKILKK